MTRVERGLPDQVVLLALLVGPRKARRDLLLLVSCASLVVICLLLLNLSDMPKRPLAAHPFDACLSAELEPDDILTEVRPQSTRLREAFVEYKQLAVLPSDVALRCQSAMTCEIATRRSSGPRKQNTHGIQGMSVCTQLPEAQATPGVLL